MVHLRKYKQRKIIAHSEFHFALNCKIYIAKDIEDYSFLNFSTCFYFYKENF